MGSDLLFIYYSLLLKGEDIHLFGGVLTFFYDPIYIHFIRCFDYNKLNLYIIVAFIRRTTMKYLSIKETALRWGISERRIQVLCKAGRIPGTITIGRTWGIPEEAIKPADARIKSGRYVQKSVEDKN